MLLTKVQFRQEQTGAKETMLRIFKTDDSGSSMAEFAVVAAVFLMLVLGIIESGRLFYTHNALTDAARRGARYAVLHQQNVNCVKNVVVYGETHLDASCSPQSGSQPLINGLTPDNVSVAYGAGFDVNNGTATVSITDFEFYLSVPLFSRTLTLPAYATTLTAESAGKIPNDISAPST